MLLRGVAWLKPLLPMTRQERARLAKLDATRDGMAIIADVLRDLSARQDAHAHTIQQAARASRGALTEAPAGTVRDMMLSHAADALARSQANAEALDRVTEAVELLAAGLRDR